VLALLCVTNPASAAYPRVSLSREITMKKLISTGFAAMMVAGMIVSTPAQAMSQSEDYCVNTLGGTFLRVGGQCSCTVTTTSSVGNSPNSQTITMTDTDASNGTLNNDPKHTSLSKCDGTGATTSPQDHC